MIGVFVGQEMSTRETADGGMGVYAALEGVILFELENEVDVEIEFVIREVVKGSVSRYWRR
jgi:hypothetical protein